MMLLGVVVIDALLVAPLGEEAVAALGLAGAIGGFLMGPLMGFSNALQISLSRAHGAKDPQRTKTALFNGLILNVLLAMLGIGVVLAFGGIVVERFAHTEAVAQDARLYLLGFLGVLVGESLGVALTTYFNGSGDTRRPFYSYALTLPVNVGLSWVLIYGVGGVPALGVFGAALGSAVAAILRAAYLAWEMERATRFFRNVSGWYGGGFRTALLAHLKFTWPIAATHLSATTSASVTGLITAKLTINQFAAMTIILPWIQFAGALGISWAMATGIIVGQMLGAQARSEDLDTFLRDAWKGAMITAVLVGAVLGGVCLGANVIYSDLEQETRTALLSFLPILLVLSFPKHSNAMCGHTLRAGGDTVYVMNLFLASQWGFRVPATFVLVVLLDVPVFLVLSLWLLEEFVKFIPFHTRFRLGRWKTMMAAP